MDHARQREALLETAAAWHDRVHRETVTEEIRAALALWLADSSEHCAAYEEIDRTWHILKCAAQNPQVLALRHETALRLTRRTSKRLRPLGWATAAIIILATMVFAGVILQEATRSPAFSWPFEFLRTHGDGRYTTRTGERLTVALKDGSQLTLNTHTELEVAFTGAKRTVHLIRGQALFEVAIDPRRPFIVTASNRRLVVLGTVFDVRLDGGQINVTMVEGTVRVERITNNAIEEAAAAGLASGTRSLSASQKSAITRPESDSPTNSLPVVTTLTAGEQLTVDSDSLDRVRSSDPERVTSWRRGQVIFENTRLADAIAELNRYSDTKIELADRALADLRLSGGFSTGRPTVFVETVTSYFPIQIVNADDHAIVLIARK